MELLNGNITIILILLFLIVTFLQSGIDKITDWNGNLNFIKGHFKNSPFKKSVPILLSIILIIETVSGILMLIGVYKLIKNGQKELALIGVELAAITLLFLLIGQRLAKDYAGAMSLAVYFIITIFSVYLLNN